MLKLGFVLAPPDGALKIGPPGGGGIPGLEDESEGRRCRIFCCLLFTSVSQETASSRAVIANA
jgi:hypothetical protein